MPFPNFAGKHALTSHFTPEQFLATVAGPSGSFPSRVVLCFQRALFEEVRTSEPGELVTLPGHDMFVLEGTAGQVGVVGGFSIGSPVAAMVVEELIPRGVREFIAVGTAGGLQLGQAIGEFVICSRAVRDEGISHHYLPPGLWVHPSAALTTRLGATLVELDIPATSGATWTIDTPYRETSDEVQHYQQQGVATVEMEAAAIFAVAKYRGVAAAAGFTISDTLANLHWDPQFESPLVARNLRQLCGAAIACLAKPSAGLVGS